MQGPSETSFVLQPVDWLLCSFGVASGLQSHCSACCRVGEAAHPGPYAGSALGASNPSGIRGKEEHLVGLGPGIWALSETRLSSVTQASTKRRLPSWPRVESELWGSCPFTCHQ